jgi:hypothetical protein
MGTEKEAQAIERVYSHLAPSGFSEDILAGAPANLAVLPLFGVPWSDWGQPERVLRTLAELGLEPAWTTGRTAMAGDS